MSAAACATAPPTAATAAATTPSNVPPTAVRDEPMSSLRFVRYVDLAIRYGIPQALDKDFIWVGANRVSPANLLAAAALAQGDDRVALTWIADGGRVNTALEPDPRDSGVWVDDLGQAMSSVAAVNPTGSTLDFELAKTRTGYLRVHAEIKARGFDLAPYLAEHEEEVRLANGLNAKATNALEVVIRKKYLREIEGQLPVAAIVTPARTGSIVILAMDETCRGNVSVYWIPDLVSATDSAEESPHTLQLVEEYAYYDESLAGCNERG